MIPVNENVLELSAKLNYAEKVKRSLDLIERAYREYGSRLVVANSLGKDSIVIWDLARKVSADINQFIITTRFKPKATKKFMFEMAASCPLARIYENSESIESELYKKDPNLCCQLLKVEPTRRAIQEMKARCWITGLRCTEGRTRTDLQEIEERDAGLIKLNPILLWTETEVWKYTAINNLPVNPLYEQGYRSLGCEPCTHLVVGGDERGGRWLGTSKCGGECGIHTSPLLSGAMQ